MGEEGGERKDGSWECEGESKGMEERGKEEGKKEQNLSFTAAWYSAQNAHTQVYVPFQRESW